MARVFITGGSGFIGTNLLEDLVQDSHEVLNFDLVPPQNPQHKGFYRQGDIRDSDVLSGAVREFRPDLVVHLAARTDLDGPTLSDYDSNIGGVRNMVEAVRRSSTVRRAVFTSTRYVHKTEIFPASDDEYSPFTLYGESKVETEKIVRSSGLEIPWLLIRPTSIWGPWFRVPYRMFFDTVRRGMYVHPKGKYISKSYGFVGNVVYQIRQFLNVDSEKVNKRTFYVSDDKDMDVLEFAKTIQRSFGAPPVREVPMAVLKSLAQVGDCLKRFGMSNPPLTSFRLNNLLTPMHYNMSGTCEVAGPSPFSLEQGVQLTVEWIRRHG